MPPRRRWSGGAAAVLQRPLRAGTGRGLVPGPLPTCLSVDSSSQSTPRDVGIQLLNRKNSMHWRPAWGFHVHEGPHGNFHRQRFCWFPGLTGYILNLCKNFHEIRVDVKTAYPHMETKQDIVSVYHMIQEKIVQELRSLREVRCMHINNTLIQINIPSSNQSRRHIIHHASDHTFVLHRFAVQVFVLLHRGVYSIATLLFSSDNAKEQRHDLDGTLYKNGGIELKIQCKLPVLHQLRLIAVVAVFEICFPLSFKLWPLEHEWRSDLS